MEEIIAERIKFINDVLLLNDDIKLLRAKEEEHKFSKEEVIKLGCLIKDVEDLAMRYQRLKLVLKSKYDEKQEGAILGLLVTLLPSREKLELATDQLYFMLSRQRSRE